VWAAARAFKIKDSNPYPLSSDCVSNNNNFVPDKSADQVHDYYVSLDKAQWTEV